LMPLTDGALQQGHDQTVVVPTLQREHGNPEQFLRMMTLLHIAGAAVPWDRVLPTSRTRVELPTYAFQRERYWLDTARTSGDVASVGLEPVGHPWLGAVTELADGEGLVFSGRVSLREFPWLADHTVYGTTIVPGTGLLELVWTAAQHVGARGVAELTLLEPLIAPDNGELHLQIQVETPDADGRRAVAVYSRRGEGVQTWTQHATGMLTEDPITPTDTEGFESLRQWPVAGAEQVGLEGFYEQLQEQGIDYGPAFQGLSELWRNGDTAYGLIQLPEAISTDGYSMHPALLDAALHVLKGTEAGPGAASTDEVLLPFEWTDVRLDAVAGSVVRVRAELDGERSVARLWVADEAGDPVVNVEGLLLREVSAEQMRSAAGSLSVDHLYRVDLQPVRPTGTPTADTGRTVIDARDWTGTVTEIAARGLTQLQHHLNDSAASGELVLVTTGAVGDNATNLGQAALWGLARSARSEHPEQTIRLIDTDHTDTDVQPALATAGEPELAIREGQILATRLTRAASETDTTPKTLDPSGTVLITGGTGELGQVLARHLVTTHGIRHLVLTSRRGNQTPGTKQLITELTAAGAATVDILARDMSDREQVRAVLTEADPAHPWTGI
ncbi:polyketide synthase dehydratase domain-containing protein, partial [Streptomyces sp. NPDC002851]